MNFQRSGHHMATGEKPPQNPIRELLLRDLPNSEKKSLETDLKWNFVLDKHSVWDKKPKPPKKTKHFLTHSQRKELNLLKLPKTGWNYDELQAMREQWKEYMRKNCHALKRSSEEAARANFSVTLAKCEFIGAEVTVIRSQIASVIGISGTVVLETRSTFLVVTPSSQLKTLLKKPSVFTFNLDGTLFTVFGKHMVVRPSERSVKKIKSQMNPDL